METRLKRFINNRRSQSIEHDNAPTRQSIPREASPPTKKPQILNGKLPDRNTPQSRKNNTDFVGPLRSFSYEHCRPGKPPVFGKLPQKGNGPVKLQTSRRLSSGDLITTSQDSQRTLQDIRDGHYVVGKKDRHLSYTPGRNKASVPQPQVPSESQVNHPSLPTPTSQRFTPSQTWPNTPTIASDTTQSYHPRDSEISDANVGLGLSSPMALVHANLSQDSLRDSSSNFSRRSVPHDNPRRWTKHTPETSATLKALRKAEYTRLVELYGSDVANRKIAQLDREHLRTPSSPAFPTDAPYSSVILEPLPPPPMEKVETESRRISRASLNSGSGGDEWSGTSSPQRTSQVSSYAESSADTGQTSLTEDETAATRENIRNMVAQMRSSYLHDIESRSAPVKSKSRAKTKKRRLLPSPIIVISDQLPPLPPSPIASRQTWHPPGTESSIQSKRRVNSNPVRSIPRLSPIQTSPPWGVDDSTGVKRADSTTLGNLMADVTRDRAKSRKSMKPRSDPNQAIQDARPITPQLQISTDEAAWMHRPSDSPNMLHNPQPQPDTTTHTPVQHHNLLLKPDPASSTAAASTSVPGDSLSSRASEDFDALFSDELWTNSSLSPSSHHTPARDLHPTLSNDSITTPRRANFIPAVPESPEYTHLAQDGDPATNFF